MKHTLAAILASALSCAAATTIEVTAKFADVPAGTVVPASPEALDKMKGIDLLSSPRVTTLPGQAATIEVSQSAAAPDGAAVPLGVTLTITPGITEKGNVSFRGKATDRFKHGGHEDESLSVMSFVAREFHFKGWAPNGSTVLLTGGPATAASAKKDGSVQVKNRELVIYLTFKKVTTEPPKKSMATTKPKTSNSKSSGTKSSGTKSSTSTKKSSGTKSGSTKSSKK